MWKRNGSPSRNPRHLVLGFRACPPCVQSLGLSHASAHLLTIHLLQVHAPILFVIIMFPVSTALVVIAFCTLPFSFSWPQNLADLAQLGRELHGYSQSGLGALAHVIGVVSATTIWMHAWSIPGSVLWVSRSTSVSEYLCSSDIPSRKERPCRRSIFAHLGNRASRGAYHNRLHPSNTSLRASFSLSHPSFPASTGFGPKHF
jgi:hypothetical protein